MSDSEYLSCEDSDDGDDDRYPMKENLFHTPSTGPSTNSPLPGSPVYETPCTPNSGLMFWGSPRNRTGPKNHPRVPLSEKKVFPLTPTNQTCPRHVPFSDRKPLPLTPRDQTAPRYHPRVSFSEKKVVPATPRNQTTGPRHYPDPHVPFMERKVLPHTPRNRPPPRSQPVTTPSANKNFSRFKEDMIAELFREFNRSVFEGQVGVKLIQVLN